MAAPEESRLLLRLLPLECSRCRTEGSEVSWILPPVVISIELADEELEAGEVGVWCPELVEEGVLAGVVDVDDTVLSANDDNRLLLLITPLLSTPLLPLPLPPATAGSSGCEESVCLSRVGAV